MRYLTANIQVSGDVDGLGVREYRYYFQSYVEGSM